MLKGASYKGFMFKKVWGKKYISRLNKKNLLCCIFFPSFDFSTASVHSSTLAGGPMSCLFSDVLCYSSAFLAHAQCPILGVLLNETT